MSDAAPARASGSALPVQFATLAWLEIRQMVGGTKLLAIGLMLAGLAALALVVRVIVPEPDNPAIAMPSLFMLMLTGVFLQTTVLLIPLALATSLIRNEIDGGTLVYLVTRPLPRPLLLLAKYVAVTAVSVVLVAAGMIVFQLAFLIPGGDPTEGAFAWWSHLFDFVLAGALGVITYGAIFALAGILFKRGLVFGLIYGFISEFVLTNVPAVVREATIMYYLRSVALSGIDPREFSLNSEDVAELQEDFGLFEWASLGDATGIVLAVTVGCLVLGALVLRGREFAASPTADE